MMTNRRLLTGLIAAALALSLPLFSGCDTGSPGPVFADNGVRSTTFTPRANQFSINTDGDIATYVRQTTQLNEEIVDHGVVLLYARCDLIVAGGQGTWAALPYTQGIEVEGDEFPYVDFTITYSYSFEPGNLYLDVISSAYQLFFSDFYADAYIPDNIPFRLVTIPPGAQIEGVDYSRYEAVRHAYGLSD
jgi:hypothetical protein